MKQCAKCQEVKELSEFSRKATAHHSYCKLCRRKDYKKSYSASEKERARVKEKNRLRQNECLKIIRECKSVPCADCNNTYPYYVMDFDHLDGSEKVNNVGWIAMRHTPAKVLEEISKCEVVCSNCHRERTHARRLDTQRRDVLN